MASMKYVLITPARNEEEFIEKTIQSVISQTILPIKWIIVSDGSTDRTDEIVKRYISRYKWIELVRAPERKYHNFASKVKCFNLGRQKVKSIKYEIIVNLDADISFEKDYFEYLIDKFSKFPKLGMVGTPYIEGGLDVREMSFFDPQYINGMCQLFRHECFEEIGGFIPSEKGGEDVFAVFTARMSGWQTRCFTGKVFNHHRKLGTRDGDMFSAKFKYGYRDFYIGNHPLWELCRSIYQMKNEPYLLGGVLLFLGYLWGAFCGIERPVSKDYLTFYRREQMQRLKSVFRRMLRI